MNTKANRIRLTESQLHRVIKESVRRVLKEVQLGGESLHGDNPTDWHALGDLQTARGWQKGDNGDYRGQERDFMRGSMNREKAFNMLPQTDMSEFDQYVGDDGAYHFPDEETRDKKWRTELSNRRPLHNGRLKAKNIGNRIGLGDYMD